VIGWKSGADVPGEAAEQWPDPRLAVEQLAASRAPLLIGVRHHSPACAAAMEAWLEAHAITRVLVELPADLQAWVQWLGHPELEAPVALSAINDSGRDLSFYPFADFSPELVAIRWAVRRGVPLEAFDLPTHMKVKRGEDDDAARGDEPAPPPPLMERLLALSERPRSESAWDAWVEARASGATPEAVRRAGLATGWALRWQAVSSGGVSMRDLARETHMRARLAAALRNPGERVAVVVGAFHAPAMLAQPMLFSELPAEAGDVQSVSSLVPYSSELLDSRSGYPAGIRDPQFRQRMFEALKVGGSVDALLGETAVEVCRRLRKRGHVASLPDAAETVRLARGLARLRNLPAPDRDELLEALQSCITRGEPLGAGRAVARVLDEVMVGERRGRLPPGAPRSGLGPLVANLLTELGLPGPGDAKHDEKELRLDPLRNRLDRRRAALLQRLRVCGVPYGDPGEDGGAAGLEALTQRWKVRWTPACDAFLERAGTYGPTPIRASEGLLRRRLNQAELDGELTSHGFSALLEQALDAGLEQLVSELLERVPHAFSTQAGVRELTALLKLVRRLDLGHFAALPREARGAVAGEIQVLEGQLDDVLAHLVERTLEGLGGLVGSTDLDDARALVALATELRDWDPGASARLRSVLVEMLRAGSCVIEGASAAALLVLQTEDAHAIKTRIASWLDLATTDATKAALRQRLQGLFCSAASLLTADPDLAQRVLERIAAPADDAFLGRLPSLRAGCSVLSPAERARLFEAWSELLGDAMKSSELNTDVDPVWLAQLAAADAYGRAAMDAIVPASTEPTHEAVVSVAGADADAPALATPSGSLISLADRVRLILGQQRDQLQSGASRSLATHLDALYGRGRGEGEGQLGQGGGTEAPSPAVRDWSGELEALFGESVREEVLGRMAELGYASALTELDPDRAPASVELLERVLSLKGALPEAHVARLRRLVESIVARLIAELATRLRPAIVGLPSPRTTKKRTGPLDLRRTVRANLVNLRPRDDGSLQMIPASLFFKSRNQRELDWRIVLVVDVSGSMEASVIYSALVAAILSHTPWLGIHFLAFSTRVLDMTGRVSDPLGLLLEVAVGGGTDIGAALAHARGLLKTPHRSVVVVVSDFEEGASVPRLLAEVRALAESGARPLGLAALDDRGAPRYNQAIASQVVSAGMPVAALTPLELVRWIGDQLR
jgi:Mg-chelatase subunit ChlD